MRDDPLQLISSQRLYRAASNPNYSVLRTRTCCERIDNLTRSPVSTPRNGRSRGDGHLLDYVEQYSSSIARASWEQAFDLPNERQLDSRRLLTQ